jgi:hypothetical protein
MVITLVAGLMSCSSEQDVASPVIAMQDSGGTNVLPLAEVHGVLSEKKGCLLLGDGVVFWPSGTTWNAERREVQFDGNFEDAANARVDEPFIGGGGVYDAVDLRGFLGESGAKAVIACLASTGADSVLMAYPD